MVCLTALACEANMEFKDCGSACPATCDDPGAPSECAEPCREGCFCKEGYVADGAECIKQEDCGCTKDGVLYQVHFYKALCHMIFRL